MTILEIPHLQDRFRAGMERRLAEVDEAVFDEARLHEVESVFHSIAGIGGTYGHPVVSTIASAVEQICAEAVRHGRALSDAELMDVRLAVRSIRHECRILELFRKAS